MTLIEKMLALKRTPPFDRLYDAELTLIAEVARDRRYGPGEVVVSASRPLQNLYVVVEGGLRCADGSSAWHVVGVESLLFDLPHAEDLTAAPGDGAACLLIAKSHFYTIVNACPELVVGLLDGPAARAAEEQRSRP